MEDTVVGGGDDSVAEVGDGAFGRAPEEKAPMS